MHYKKIANQCYGVSVQCRPQLNTDCIVKKYLWSKSHRFLVPSFQKHIPSYFHKLKRWVKVQEKPRLGISFIC